MKSGIGFRIILVGTMGGGVQQNKTVHELINVKTS